MIFMKTMFSLILNASLASAAIILLLVFIRKLFHLRLTPRFIHVLWFLVLIKLLVPVGPSSSISLFNLVPQAIADQWTTDQSHPADNSGSVKQRADTFGSSDETKAVLQQRSEEALPFDLSASRLEDSDLLTATPLSHSGEQDRGGSNILKIGLWIWLGGLVFLSMYYLIVTLRFRKQLRFAHRINNEEVLSVLKACSKQLGMKPNIPVYEISGFQSPWIYGMLKPSIYLPEDMVVIADSQQLRHVLLHEMAHYKRKDLLFNSLWTLAVWLHWFNPLVWLARQKMASDREMACDAVVLEALGEQESSSYGMTLLQLSRFTSRSSHPRINLSFFFNNKNETKRRVMMITKFKQGSYKLSATAIVLILVLSAVLLTNANVNSNASQAADSNDENTVSSFQIDRPIPSFKWFHNLDRALAFSTFDFKVPDYLPEGYRLRNVDLNENFSKSNKSDLIELVTITFVSNFGQQGEQNFEIKASKGSGTLLEHQLLWGASYSQESGRTPSYRQEDLTLGSMKGIMYTTARSKYKQKSETAKSFVWQENDVTYSINYYSADLIQEELVNVVQSFALPDQVQSVDYKGEGNSFPLYDETDLQEAKQILGFPVKFPFALSDYGLKLSDSVLQQADDQNTGFYIRPDTDALMISYRVPYNSSIYDTNDSMDYYQSKAPIVDASKLSFLHKLEINGIEISAYADKDHIYWEPIHLDNNQLKFKSQTYYVWKQDGIYYTVFFLGVDKHQEENLEALVLATVQ
ncbi:M56 family metallopeptidase [Paenibacillus luteus]|uniref:M56 family metallopeptidase n=1 Tax=Paenibacillus luteus TaxID=2545753 RepID=UPI001144BBC9|nr:M56 family metallopeptidase [Paenibacillus luteus]